MVLPHRQKKITRAFLYEFTNKTTSEKKNPYKHVKIESNHRYQSMNNKDDNTDKNKHTCLSY